MNIDAKRWSGLLSLILLVLAAAFCFACSKSSTTENAGGQKGTQGPQATTSGKTDAKLVSAREAWAQVADQVTAWDSGFRVASAQGGGAPANDATGKESGWDFYVESADQKRSTEFYFVAEETGGVKQGVTKGEDTPFSTGRDTFDAESWKIDSTEAVEKALAAFKSQKYSDFAGGAKAELSVQNGKLIWEVELSNKPVKGVTPATQSGTVQVDAQTGEVVSVK
jgi:uncharacterized membrane protein YkoI